MVFTAVLKSNIPNGIEGDCINYHSLNDKNVLVASLAVTTTENQIPVRLYNYSNSYVILKKGERVATFFPMNNDKDDNNVNNDILPDPSQHIPLNSISVETTCPSENALNGNAISTPNIDLSNSNLNDAQKSKLRSLINQYSDCFVDPKNNQLGCTNLLTHKIEVFPNSKPVQRLPYRTSPHMRNEMKNIIEEQLSQNVIEKTTEGDWASPAILVRKANNGGYRLVIDYRGLNAVTMQKYLRIPRLDQILDDIGENKPKFFSTFDLQSGFHQVPLDEDSRNLTGFLTPFGKFRYKTMPQGISGAPNSFQSLLDALLKGIQYKYVVAYIDDICCFSPTFESHVNHIESVFQRLRSANLKLKPSKCHFAVEKITFLGHVIQRDGVSPNPDKIKCIKDYPALQKVKHVRSFLGLIGFFRRFIPLFGQIAKPLYELTKKNVKFVWTEECENAFQTLKNRITEDTVLAYPDFTKTFILSCDASQTGIGSFLAQYDSNNKLRPIAYTSRAFTKSESNYTTTEQELLAVIYSFKHFQVYLEGTHFELHTDHAPLKWILGKKELSPRLARWALIIQGQSYTVKHIKGSLNVVPDALSRIPHTQPPTRTKPDEEIDAFPDLSAINTDPILSNQIEHYPLFSLDYDMLDPASNHEKSCDTSYLEEIEFININDEGILAPYKY